jgi:hypothetical protein
MAIQLTVECPALRRDHCQQKLGFRQVVRKQIPPHPLMALCLSAKIREIIMPFSDFAATLCRPFQK